MISVALCTYNGERFLPRQLASIGEQSQPPDELVICDDGSTDRTLSLCEAFAARAPFPVRIHRNAKNLGSSKNFEQAVALCEQPWVALCDQDDAWRADKLEVLTAAAQAHPQAGFFFSDGQVIGVDDEPLGFGLWEAIGFTGWERRAFADGRGLSVLMRRNVVTGAAMMLRKAALEGAPPVAEGWVHDYWFALMLHVRGEGRPIPERLIEYRVHPSQQIGVRQQTLAVRARQALRIDRRLFADEAARCHRAHEALAQWAPGHASVQWMRQRAQLNQRRADYANRPRPLRLPAATLDLVRGRYRRCAFGVGSFLQDVLRP